MAMAAGRGGNYSLHTWDADSGALVASVTVPAARGAPPPHALLAACGSQAPTAPRWLAVVSTLSVGPPALVEFQSVSGARSGSRGASGHPPHGLGVKGLARVHVRPRDTAVDASDL